MNWAIKLLRRINWSFILIPVLVGGPFLVIGLSEVYKTTQTINAFASARGTVVDNVWRAFAQGGAAYTPVIEFQTADGQTIRFTDGIGTYPAEYEEGAQVNILYDPQDVHHARINSWKRIWFGPTLITAIGVLPILVGFGLAWLMRSKGDL
jgi:hypothetical protein